MKQLIRSTISLSRWREYSFYYVSLLVLVLILGNLQLQPALLWVSLGNYFGLMFAFMINEVEDAPEDSLDSLKRLKNPVAAGLVSYVHGWRLAVGVGLVSLACYAMAGFSVYLLGVVNFFLSFGYSWRRLKLKRYFLVDIVTHGFILGGLQFLTGYIVVGGKLIDAALLFGLVFLASMTGQLYNQLRDAVVDAKSGHKNTVAVIGSPLAVKILYSQYALLGGVFVVLVWRRMFPLLFLSAVFIVWSMLFIEDLFIGRLKVLFVKGKTRSWAYKVNLAFSVSGLLWFAVHWF